MSAVLAPPPKPIPAYRPDWQDHIPAELVERPQWVVWAYEFRDGKWTKVPYDPKAPARNARANDPRTWGTFDRAVKAWEREPSVFSGVGYEFAHDDPYAGADFDNCILPGGEMAEWAAPHLDAIGGTFGDVSPSGRGVKFIARAELPIIGKAKAPTGTRRGGFGPDGSGAIEIYDRGRFFTIMGNPWGDSLAIADRQEAVEALFRLLKEGGKPKRKAAANDADPWIVTVPAGPSSLADDALVERARRATNGEKFRALFDAGDLAGCPSDSEADLALCNLLAFWTGRDEARIERLWLASALGQREKVRERADYRQMTIAKAIEDCRETYSPNGRAHRNGEAHGREAAAEEPAPFANYEWEEGGKDEQGNPKAKKVALSLRDLHVELDGLTPDWPKRVGQDATLFTEGKDHRPVYLDSATKLFAWIGARTQIDWTKGSTFHPQDRFYEHLRMSAQHFDAIETLPHFPPLPKIYYMHPPVGRGDGSAIEKFIGLFCPFTEMDRQLIRAMLLTPFWGGQPGSRPAFLITGPDNDPKRGRGVGKSTLVDVVVDLVGKSIDVSPTDQIADVKTRLLSDMARHARIARLDNVKTLRLSWADLEGLITAREISGRQLFKGEGSRPNSVVWCITLNGASLSTDMAQRCVVVKLGRPTYRAAWEAEVKEFVQANRAAILADIRTILEAPAPEIATRSRWAPWEREVIGRCPMANLLQDVIAERQVEVDDDDEEAATVADYFRNVLAEGYGREINPDCDQVFIPSLEAAMWLNMATNQKLPTNRASAYLGGLGIPELRKSDRGKARGWVWRGKNAGPHHRTFHLRNGQAEPGGPS